MGPGPRPMGPLARAKKKWRTTPGRSVQPRQTGATFFLPGPKGPWALGPGPWPLVVYYYIITPLFYIIILFYILFYIFHILFYIFSKSFERLCPSPEYKITLLTLSKNFEADFLDFDIFHIFSPKTYFGGRTATTATTTAEEFPQTFSPHAHHAQG